MKLSRHLHFESAAVAAGFPQSGVLSIPSQIDSRMSPAMAEAFILKYRPARPVRSISRNVFASNATADQASLNKTKV